MMRKMHGILVTVHFHAFLVAIVLIAEAGKTAWITRPHIPFSCTFSYPFSHDLAGATGLRNTKGKHTGFEGIGYTGHGSNEWIAVRCIGDRAVDALADASRSKYGNAGHGIFYMPLDSLQVVAKQLE